MSVQSSKQSSIVALAALLFWWLPQVRSFPAASQHCYILKNTLETSTELAWSLPAPLANSFGANKRWYEDIGTSAVDRHIVYQDDEECPLWDHDADYCDGYYSYPRMSFLELEDDTLLSLDHHVDNGSHHHVPRKRIRPLRMARGIWRRIRRNPRSTGVL